MARARNIKPAFFANEYLADLPFHTRLMFIGLWTLADREGRFEDRPRRIKIQLFPLDDGLDIDLMLSELSKSGFLIRYEAAGIRYCQIVNFTKHQMPHHKEAASEIPPPDGMPAITRHAYDVSQETRAFVFSRDGDKCLKCGERSSLTIDHIIPLSKGGDNSELNLQTLCHKCNSAKGDASKSYVEGIVAPTSDRTNYKTNSTLPQRKTIIGESSPSDCGLPLTSSLNPSSPIEAIASKKPPAPKKFRTQFPDGFYPDETGIRLAEESKVSVAIELQAFANHHKAKGSLMADWQAAWRTWVGNSVKFGNARASPAFKTIHDQRAETIAALTGRNRNERTTANERDITGEAIRVA